MRRKSTLVDGKIGGFFIVEERMEVSILCDTLPIVIIVIILLNSKILSECFETCLEQF